MSLDAEFIAPKQFLAIVGSNTNEIKKELSKLVTSDEDQRVFTLKNDYYRANIGVQQFDEMKHLIEAAAHEKIFPAVFIVYNENMDLTKLVDQLKASDKLDIDMKILIVPSAIGVDVAKFEIWSTENLFEIVYLKSTDEQVSNAKSMNEKWGYERLVEILDICNWPFRHSNLKPVSGNPHLDRILRLVTELDDDEGETKFDFPINDRLADTMFDEFLVSRGFQVECISTKVIPSFTPEPQHAERVHLSPDSPTTETISYSQEGANVTADFSFVCHKPAREQVDQKADKNADEVIVAINKKKKKKSKGKGA